MLNKTSKNKSNFFQTLKAFLLSHLKFCKKHQFIIFKNEKLVLLFIYFTNYCIFFKYLKAIF